jgi:hypothetical protein
MADTTPKEKPFSEPFVWSNRSIDLISDIWGTASSNVADNKLNDLELDIRTRSRSTVYARSAAEPMGCTAFTILGS